jgi:hypothetical protein
MVKQKFQNPQKKISKYKTVKIIKIFLQKNLIWLILEKLDNHHFKKVQVKKKLKLIKKEKYLKKF